MRLAGKFIACRAVVEVNLPAGFAIVFGRKFGTVIPKPGFYHCRFDTASCQRRRQLIACAAEFVFKFECCHAESSVSTLPIYLSTNLLSIQPCDKINVSVTRKRSICP